LPRKNPKIISVWYGRKKEILFSIMKGGGTKQRKRKLILPVTYEIATSINKEVRNED
jgi:hypothetical protein